MRRFIAEYADFRRVEGKKLFTAFTAGTHFARRSDQQSNGCLELPGPCVGRCAVDKLLNFIVVQPAVDADQRESAAG